MSGRPNPFDRQPDENRAEWRRRLKKATKRPAILNEPKGDPAPEVVGELSPDRAEDLKRRKEEARAARDAQFLEAYGGRMRRTTIGKFLRAWGLPIPRAAVFWAVAHKVRAADDRFDREDRLASCAWLVTNGFDVKSSDELVRAYLEGEVAAGRSDLEPEDVEKLVRKFQRGKGGPEA